MTSKILLAAGLAVGPLLLAPWSVGANTGAIGTDQPTEKIEPLPKAAEQPQDRPLPPSPRKPGRVVQFELTEEYDRGLLPPGRRVGLTVRVLGDLGKLSGAGVAIVESVNSARTLISLAPGHDSSVLEATTSVELPALVETIDPEGMGVNGGTGPVQMVRINVTFARLQGMKLEPLFKRRVYLALGHGGSSVPAVLSSSPAPREIQIQTADVSISPEGDPPSVPGIVDEVVIETDLMHGTPISSDLRDYWREISRRIRHRWTERNSAITEEKTVRAPRVRFRLYPNGIAQMIYLERSSGNSRVDIAGLESVLDTQPYLPLRTKLSEPYVNVHVQFHGEHTKR